MPDVPVYPILSGRGRLPDSRRPYPNVLDVGPAVYLSQARYAIAQALKCIGLKPGSRVLIPAYHCDSMILPLGIYGAEPIFYRVKDDLRADVDDVLSKIDDRTRAVIATHYFGFHQDVVRLRELCDRRGLSLIEDCAHSLYGTIEGAPIGSYGDYAVASLWKFFAVTEGACLVSARHLLSSVRLRPCSWRNNFATMINVLDQARYHGNLWPLQPLQAAVGLARRGRKLWATHHGAPADTDEADVAAAESPDGLSSDFKTDSVDRAMSGFSYRLFRVLSRSGRDIAEARRSNYRWLSSRISSIPGCRPVLPDLPDDVVPFMLPLWIERLGEVFPRLEDAAMPMQRFGQFLWPGIDQSTCPVSARLSRNAIQIPCHQGLSFDDLEWIVETIRDCCDPR